MQSLVQHPLLLQYHLLPKIRTSSFIPFIPTVATGRCHLEKCILYLYIGQRQLLAATIHTAIYLMRKGSLWRCSWNISLGLNPRTDLDELGIIPAPPQDVPRAGRSAEGKGHLNQFIFELTGISCGKSMVEAMPFSICLIFLYTILDFHLQITFMFQKMKIHPGKYSPCRIFLSIYLLYFISLVLVLSYLMVRARSLELYFSFFFFCML